MAKTPMPATWRHGFKEMLSSSDDEERVDGKKQQKSPLALPSIELITSSKHNSLGINKLRTFPTLYNGTSSPHGVPDWWKPKDEVDVLICGAGPSGLETAVSLARQGISFRIIDKSEAPLLAGRADGVQPRFLEILHSWGLASEVAEEGPLIERTAIYKDGKKLLFGRSHQSDSRYRGLHIITQGQVERIYIRDLLRHQILVERGNTVTSFKVDENINKDFPVEVVVHNEKSQSAQTIRAKFLVGSDGAASSIRKQLAIPFEGVSTGIYWGIMDCVFDTDYPHAWVFGSVISTKHGGCVIIPREDGYIRLYTQLDVTKHGDLAKSRATGDADTASQQESGGAVDIDSITPEEVLEQANRIFAPYKLKFAAPLSWFAVWKISERVARSFSSADLRVHLAGDAAHVHSVMGAFGLNASIMDASNLAWKLGLCARGAASLTALCDTYNAERGLHARRIIRTSGEYLRFVCGSDVPLAEFDISSEPVTNGNGTEAHVNGSDTPATTNGHSHTAMLDDTKMDDMAFLHSFFSRHSQFLLGVDAGYSPSVLTPCSMQCGAIGPQNGVRAPNPRVCFSTSNTGYLYDVLTGVDRFHIVLMVGEMLSDSSLPSRASLARISTALASPKHFFSRYGGASRFHIVVVAKGVPFDAQTLLRDPELAFVTSNATLVFDDRTPDDDAHAVYEVDRACGAAVVVRPDLWIGTSATLDDAISSFDAYFAGFLLKV